MCLKGRFFNEIRKRDFSFNVVTFANLSFNIPNVQAYGSFTGELYRISKD